MPTLTCCDAKASTENNNIRDAEEGKNKSNANGVSLRRILYEQPTGSLCVCLCVHITRLHTKEEDKSIKILYL